MTPQQMQARLAARRSGPPDAASVERWRTEMTAAELRQFDEIAGDCWESLATRGRETGRYASERYQAPAGGTDPRPC